MAQGNPREDLKAKLRTVATAGQKAGIELADVLALHQPKYTRESFTELFKGGPKDLERADAVLTRWVQMIRAKQQQQQPQPAAVLPSHQELAPTLGMPKETPLPSDQLNKKLAKLIELAEKVDVGVDQVPTRAGGQAMTLETLTKLIGSDNVKARTMASKIMEEWTDAIRAKHETVKQLRGVTPKHTPPAPPVLTGGARWIPIEDYDEIRNATLDIHNTIRKKYGMPPVAYNMLLEPGALEWAYHLASRLPYKDEHCLDRIVPGLGDPGENITNDESGGGGTGGFEVQWIPDHAGMVKRYESEVRMYDLEKKTGKPGFTDRDYGHFTQVIWRETKFVAVGFAIVETPIVRKQVATKYRKKRGVWVHRYYPGGNTAGRFAENT